MTTPDVLAFQSPVYWGYPFVALMGALALVAAFKFFSSHFVSRFSQIACGVAVAGCALMVAINVALAPVSYRIENRALVVRRRLHSLTIPFTDIARVESIATRSGQWWDPWTFTPEMNVILTRIRMPFWIWPSGGNAGSSWWSSRSWHVSGPCGWVGRTVDVVDYYLTDPGNAVAMRLRDRWLVISPDDPERFVVTMRARLEAIRALP